MKYSVFEIFIYIIMCILYTVSGERKEELIVCSECGVNCFSHSLLEMHIAEMHDPFSTKSTVSFTIFDNYKTKLLLCKKIYLEI